MGGLLGSSVLEVVIGLAFVYFLLSVICSSINEVIAGATNLRAKQLIAGIYENLLRDPTLARTVIEHPLVSAMGSTIGPVRALIKKMRMPTPVSGGVAVGPVTPGVPAAMAAGRPARARYLPEGLGLSGPPSYIPARAFTLALFDSLMPDRETPITVEAVRSRALEMTQSGEKGLHEVGVSLLRLIDASKVTDPAQAALRVDEAKRVIQQLSTQAGAQLPSAFAEAQSLDEIRRLVESLPAGALRTASLNLVEAGQTTLQNVTKSVEDWFDSAMQRVSGEYKRQVQLFLIFIAFAVSVLIGADTFQIMNSLSNNPSVRAAIVAQAGQLTQGGQQQTPPQLSTDQALQLLNSIQLPMGYSDMPTPVFTPNWLLWLGKKIAGLLVTTFAVALGAPFWFEVLQKVANLRAAGQPPATSSSSAQAKS